MKRPTMKLDADEKELLESVERGEWKSAKGGKRGRARYSRYAKATFRKDRRLSIRLSSKDLEVIQKRALAEDLPSQTLISSLLHKYATGWLKESDRCRVDRLPKHLSIERRPLRAVPRSGPLHAVTLRLRISSRRLSSRSLDRAAKRFVRIKPSIVDNVMLTPSWRPTCRRRRQTS